MRRIVAWAVVSAVVGAWGPAALRAESVFDASGTRPSRVVLALDARGAGFGTASAVAGELDVAGGGEGESVSPLKAAAASFLLPGLGAQRLGHTLRSRIYFGLEGISWISIGSFLWAGHARENSYKDYAVAFAGVTGTGHSDDFYRDIGDYMSSDGPGGFNETVRRDARDLYYPNVAAMDAYYRAHRMTGEASWSWRSSDAFRRYGTVRDASRFAYRVALYSAVAAAALRVASAADAVRLARIDNRAHEASRPRVSIGFDEGSRGLALWVQRSF